MVPRFRPNLNRQELLQIFKPSKSDAVEKFEAAFAKKMEQEYAVAFPYGRTALMFLIEALCLKEKEVICPSYTCVVVPHAITFSGNEPVFIDSDPTDFNMDFSILDEAINERTGAIVFTSIFGNPVNLDKVDRFKKKYPKIRIIQDCAHSFNARHGETPVNTYGDAAIYGLNVSKIMTSVFGGMVTTDNQELYLKLKEIQKSQLKKVGFLKSIKRRVYLLAIFIAFNSWVYALVFRLEKAGFLNYFVKYYKDGVIDMPKDHLDMMSPFEASVGIIQLNKFQKTIEERVMIGQRYDQLLNRKIIKGKTYSHYPVVVTNKQKALKFANIAGYQLGDIINYSCPNMTAYTKNKNYFFEYDNSKVFSGSVINLPIVDLREKRIKELLNAIKPLLKDDIL